MAKSVRAQKSIMMNPPNSRQALLFIVTLGLAIGAAGPATLARQKAPPVAYPAPPDRSLAAPVGLPERMIADAAAYDGYIAHVTATSPVFTDGASVADALLSSASYQPRALIRGAVAYGAVAALGSSDFVASLRAVGASSENRRLMVNYILSDPTYAFKFKGSDKAAGLVKEALGAAALRLFATGKTIKQSAYAIQHQTWSRGEISNRSGRLAAVEAAETNGLPAAADRVGIIDRAAREAQPLDLTAPPAKPPYTPLVAQALQLAAIAAIGEANDNTYDRLSALTQESNTDTCLHMAKLNLYQCLAVAKPHYEDVFCMGQHAMIDTGRCIARNAGLDLPIDASPAPEAKAAAPAPHHHRG